MTLALRLGRTVEELRQTMTARELTLWMAYDQQSPISDRRGDVQSAQVAMAVLQSQGAKVSFDDVLLDWGGGGEDAPAADDEALEMLFAGLAGSQG